MTAHGHTAETKPKSALFCRAAWVRLGVVATIGLIVDLVSKWAAFRFIADEPVALQRSEVIRVARMGRPLADLIPHHDPITILPSLLDFTLVLNKGAVFGIGAGGPWVLFTILGLGVGIWMFGVWTRPGDRAAHVAIGLLLAGGLGNLYDRIVYACVRDFIHPLPGVPMPFGWRMPIDGGREIWPYVSNIADLWLIVGIAMFMWHLWRTGRDHPPRTKPSQHDTPSTPKPPKES